MESNRVLGAPAIVANPSGVAAYLGGGNNDGLLKTVAATPAALVAQLPRMSGDTTPPLAQRARVLSGLLTLREVPDR